uniref:Protein PRD1 n=1 Tax=Kalanchoe fedtschenkoi TaxID=63787 RepID=A0A7N0TTA4_KALFE
MTCDYDDSQGDEENEGIQFYSFEESIAEESASSISSSSCSQGHRSSLNLRTLEGGSICLVCFSNLITSPNSPTVHVSYALAQLSIALSHRPFLEKLVRFHSHLLVSPLVQAMADIGDEKISDQIVDLVSEICRSADGSSLCGDFVTRISDMFSSGCLAWSKSQAHMLHCFGVILNIMGSDPFVHIKDTKVFLSYLVQSLQMPSDDIRGEIMFVLYRLVIYHYESIEDLSDDFYGHCPKLLHVSLDALMKTQSDDVRLNCVALLAVFAQRGAFEDSFVSEKSRLSDHVHGSSAQRVEGTQCLNTLFAEAVKGPLLSSDSQVQIGTLELIYHHLSWKCQSTSQIQALVEESIADYIFEVLRLSEKNDAIIDLCLKVLDILAKADQVFSQRLPIGFSTLLLVLRLVTEVPFHPVQSHALKLILRCVSDCPGIISIHHIEELGLLVTKLLERHIDGEMGMHPETFNLAVSLLVALIRTPSSAGMTNFAISLKGATNHAVSACLSSCENPTQFLFSLYFLKEAYDYSHLGIPASLAFVELRSCILDICKTHLLPWIMENIHDLEKEEIVMGILETFHALILPSSGDEDTGFARILASSSWFSFSFECMGLYSTETMRLRVFMLLGVLVDALLGGSSGNPIKDAALQLPSDPKELLVILQQRSGSNYQLRSCQNAALLILYVSSFYNERLADEKLVLDALEQYIIGNSCDLSCNAASLVIMQLVNNFALYRGLAKMTYQISYSPEAERILFQLICESDWDFLTVATHPVALKWLFQQDKISEPLSLQILKICRNSYSSEVLEDKCRNNLAQSFAELVEDGDNYVAMLFICMLRELLECDGCQQDIESVMHMMLTIVNICPSASSNFCSHGIGNVIHTLYSHTSHPSFLPLALRLVFNILSSVQPEELSDEDVWVAMTVKLVENMSAILTSSRCSLESAVVIGILSLILNHSAGGVLTESAKIILLNTSWAPAIKKLTDASCSTSQAVNDSEIYDGSVETLLLVLLLQHFSQKSLPVVLPGYLNWHCFLDSLAVHQSSICFHCNDLCRLLYYGSPLVKLAASKCLTQLFTSISKEMSNYHSLNCDTKSLMPLIAVLEGLIFCSNINVAMNCALCLTTVLQWKNMDLSQTTRLNKWCRFITEELVMSMVAPCLASTPFTENHKAAARVSVGLLRLESVPQWMKTVFDKSCISEIVANLSVSSISTDLVLLFRELLESGYLNPGHITSVEKVLQACRKNLYFMSTEENELKNYQEKLTGSADNAYNVCDILIHLMLTESSPRHTSKSQQNVHSSLIEAIDLFFMSLAERKDIQELTK